MKSHHLLLVILLFFIEALQGQQARLDSLLRVNEEYKRQDEKKLQLLLDLADVYRWMQFDTGLIISDQAISLATKLNHQRGLALANDYKGYTLFQMGKPEEARALYDKALDLQTDIGDSLGMAFTYTLLSPIMTGDDMRIMGEKGLQLYERHQDLHGIAMAYLTIGYYYNGKDLNLSLEYNHKALTIFTAEKDELWIANALVTICISYYSSSEYKLALSYAQRAKDISSHQGIRFIMLTSDWMAGICYTQLADYPKALEYDIEAQKLADYMGNALSSAALLINIGNLYLKIKNLEDARKYFDLALELSRKVGYKDFENGAHAGIGAMLLQQGKFSEALQEFHIALELGQEIKSEYLIADAHASLAEVNLKQGNYEKALAYSKKVMEFNIDNNDAEIDSRNYLIQARALLLAPDEVLVRAGYNPKDRNEIVISKLLACVDMVKGSGELDFHRDALKELSEVYERSGNEKLAFDYFKKYTVLNDSILNTEKFNSIATLQMQYETDKSEKEIALLKSQREVDRLQAARRLGMNFGLGGALLGILFVAGAFYRQSKKTERINTDLEKSNRELKETQQQLVRSEKMAAFGKMASRMAHEILNPLNFVNNFSELSEELIREMVVSDDQTEIKASAYALLENMERIHHHGVRAERIIQELQERTRAGTTHEYFESDNA